MTHVNRSMSSLSQSLTGLSIPMTIRNSDSNGEVIHKMTGMTDSGRDEAVERKEDDVEIQVESSVD